MSMFLLMFNFGYSIDISVEDYPQYYIFETGTPYTKLISNSYPTVFAFKYDRTGTYYLTHYYPNSTSDTIIINPRNSNTIQYISHWPCTLTYDPSENSNTNGVIFMNYFSGCDGGMYISTHRYRDISLTTVSSVPIGKGICLLFCQNRYLASTLTNNLISANYLEYRRGNESFQLVSSGSTSSPSSSSTNKPLFVRLTSVDDPTDLDVSIDFNGMDNTEDNAISISSELIPRPLPTPTPLNTPNQSPYRTPEFTPYKTPEQTPELTPYRTLQQTPYQTPEFTPCQSPEQTPYQSPEFTPCKTPEQTPELTPYRTLQLTPYQTPEFTPCQSPEQTPYQSPEQTPYQSPEQTPYQSPEQTPYQSPEQTPYQSPEQTPYQSPEQTPYQSPRITPYQTLVMTPYNTPYQSYSQSNSISQTYDVIGTPSNTIDSTPFNTPEITPHPTPVPTPKRTPRFTPIPSETPYVDEFEGEPYDPNPIEIEIPETHAPIQTNYVRDRLSTSETVATASTGAIFSIFILVLTVINIIKLLNSNEQNESETSFSISSSETLRSDSSEDYQFLNQKIMVHQSPTSSEKSLNSKNMDCQSLTDPNGIESLSSMSLLP